MTDIDPGLRERAEAFLEMMAPRYSPGTVRAYAQVTSGLCALVYECRRVAP